MEQKLLISAKTKEGFKLSLSNNKISFYLVAFIQDTKEIWTLGMYYPCPYSLEEILNFILELLELDNLLNQTIENRSSQIIELITQETLRATNKERSLELLINKSNADLLDVLDSKLDKNTVYTKELINEKLSGIYKVKGSRTFEELPIEGNSVGDVYNITNLFILNEKKYDLGTNVVWTEEGWDALAGIFDYTGLEDSILDIDIKVNEESARALEKELLLNNKFNSYLPLNGGTLTGNLHFTTLDNGIISVGNATTIPGHIYRGVYDSEGNVYDHYYNGNVTMDYTYANLRVKYPSGFKTLRFGGNGAFSWDGNKIWHEGNDGPNSGLDADTLDGVQLLNVMYNNFDNDGKTDTTAGNQIIRVKGSFETPCDLYEYGDILQWTGRPNYSTDFDNLGNFYHLLYSDTSSKSNLYHRTKVGSANWTSWRTVAFTDSDITGNAATATDADMLDGKHGSNYLVGVYEYNTNTDAADTLVLPNVLCYGSWDNNLFFGFVDTKFYQKLSTTSNRAQMVYGYDQDKIYYRRYKDNWKPWKTIAFTDSNITGNAATATKATQDSEGNVITDTYALKSDLIIGLNITDGVYAVKADGALCTIDEADTSCTGVALIAGEHKFMIAKTDATDGTNNTLYWGKNLYGKDVAGVVNNNTVDGTNSYGYLKGSSTPQLDRDFTNWTAGALAEFDGKANTAAILAAYTEHGVSMNTRDMCSVLNTFNQAEQVAGRSADWYVPTCGQVALIYLNMTEINLALFNIGGTTFSMTSRYWSSSEYNSNRRWFVNFDIGRIEYAYSDNDVLRVRFIRDIQVESPKSVKESITEIKDQLKQPAESALKLATPVKLWGNNFDGSNYIENQSVTVWRTPYNFSGLWSRGINCFDKNGSVIATIGFYGNTDTLENAYIGKNQNSQWVSVLPNGNVGIGTTNPLYKLDVNGAAHAYYFVAGHDVGYHLLDSNGVANRSMCITPGNNLLIGYDTGDKGFGTSIDGNVIKLRYGTTHTNGLILNSSGNITIGSSDLADTNHKLYVNGNTNITLMLYVNGYMHAKNRSYFNNNLYFVKDSNANGFFIDFNTNGKLVLCGTEGTTWKKNILEVDYDSNKVSVKDFSVRNSIDSGDLVDWYGVSWSENSSDPTCTRIGNMALHRSLPIQSAMKGYYIGNNRNNCGEIIIPIKDDWTGIKYHANTNDYGNSMTHSVGEVMIKIPEFWYIDEYEPSTKTHNLKISQTAKAGWCHHKEAYVGAYEGYDDGSYYRSAKDYIPTVSVTRETLRTKARANGHTDEYKWNIYTYEEHRAICHLFLVEYATRNSQAPVNTALTADGFKQGGLGSGCTTGTMGDAYSFIPTGTTDSLGNGSGQVAYTAPNGITYYTNRYRGIENPFGHIWKHTDDIVNVYNSTYGVKTVYKCDKPEHFATNKNAKYKPLCSFPGGSKMQGWSKEIKATINCDFFKYSIGGNESTYWCDYNYDSDDTSEHCLLIGGRSGNGGGAGLFYFYLDNSVGGSDVSLGSRLTYLPWAE